MEQYIDINGQKILLTQELIDSNPDILNKIDGKSAYFAGRARGCYEFDKIDYTVRKQEYKYILPLSIMLVMVMIVSNILSSKLVSLYGFTITGGMFIYPLSYIFDYVITDVYGFQYARRVVWSAFFSMIFFTFCIWLVIVLPPSKFWHLQSSYSIVFGNMIRTYFASSVTFLFSFMISSYVFQKVKVKKRGFLFQRILRSLLVSEMVDTGLFCLIAFYGVWPIENMLHFLVFSFCTKVVYEVIMYPIVTKRVIDWFKRAEQSDMLDSNTNFSPFRWEVDYNQDNNLFRA
ncbi:queuosine precursor transporter [Vibrio marisflavi]|uniref:Probable queuosine precursor transporter n=1 Tax=Vibrio marisflavi CECT 7928 TaxID=634439 RepID=A0ABN8E390_9VIBR|nr:queuosine precursor transporter [Vibrio marisflavi]CAH0537767.1 queuosine precursor transporter [Vibrio marisflavi CECT 7928]